MAVQRRPDGRLETRGRARKVRDAWIWQSSDRKFPFHVIWREGTSVEVAFADARALTRKFVATFGADGPIEEIEVVDNDLLAALHGRPWAHLAPGHLGVGGDA